MNLSIKVNSKILVDLIKQIIIINPGLFFMLNYMRNNNPKFLNMQRNSISYLKFDLFVCWPINNQIKKGQIHSKSNKKASKVYIYIRLKLKNCF